MLIRLRRYAQLAVLAAGVATAAPALSALLGFDDLPGTLSPLAPVPAGYGGLLWSGPEPLYSIRGSYLPGTGYEVAPTSGAIVVGPAFAQAPVAIRVSGLGNFDFLGGWFTAAYDDQSLVFTGRRGGVTQYTSSPLAISTGAPVHLEFTDWLGLDELVIGNSVPGSQWAMDDFEYALYTPLPGVPLPPALLLFASGLALLLRRRR